MKIALNAWFQDMPHTGSGQYARQLEAALREIAPHVDIAAVRPRARDNASKVWFEQVGFPRAADRMRADVALTPYWAPPLHSRTPAVVTVHDVIPLALPDYRGGPLQRAYTSLVRAASANAAHIITDSEFSRKDILKHLPVRPESVSAIPLAADARFTPFVPAEQMQAVRERYNLPDSYVLYLSNFDRRKNIETLMQVYVWCGEPIGHDFPLVIAGEPDTPVFAHNGRKMTLAQMAKELEVDDVVHFIGRVAEEDKPAVYAGARCFLFTSLYEGFGLPALEALACGVPVVGSNAASIPEVVGDAGMLVDPMDARRMAGAVIAVCTEDVLHDQLSRRALLQAAKFSWQRTAFETLAVLKSVVRS
ncbi:MAG: glycosyltransferase family 1 protein [Anaerolineae bacterium]|nr:glycosyltransferase family 4 protein [Thermoflexales bacterium]MDW8407850.1 glycosyltransferase family 1 protein [Anaerolineae bacterium]